MKILHVISSVDPLGGGPVESVKQRGMLLVEWGHTVEVVSLDAPDAPGIAGFPLSLYALGPSRSSYRYNARLVPWLKANAKNYDAVVVDGLWQYHSFATFLSLANTNIPYFVFTHGMLDPWFKRRYPLKHIKKWLYWPWAEYHLLRNAQAVLFTCEEERLLARQSFWLYRCNEVVVNFGTSVPATYATTNRRLFIETYPELQEKKVFLFLSRIHPKKACDLLIEAFASATQRDETIHLVIAGPDQTGWKSELQSLARRLGVERKITWTGMLTGDLKWGAYYTADAFVLPSHQENFGIVVAEALACGLPVLISNKVNIWREIMDDRAGLVANDDLAGTVALLNGWLDLSEEQKAVMRTQAKACFNDHFEMSRAATSLVDVIAEHL